MAEIIVFGEVMLELSGIEGDRARLGVAGDTFNTAVYLARAGHAVTYATALGDDPFSDRIMRALDDEKIATDMVLRVPGGTPGLYAVSLDEHGERSFTYWRAQSAARGFFSAPGADEALSRMAASDALYFSGITLSLFDGTARTRLADVAASVRARGGILAFDTNYRPRGWSSPEVARAAIAEIAPHVTHSLPTFEDEEALFGYRDPSECIAFWRDQGAGDVIVKQGATGAWLTDGSLVPPPAPVRPLDTTGAGDSFNGGCLGALLNGADQRDAALAGHRLAAKVLMTPGAILPREPADAR